MEKRIEDRIVKKDLGGGRKLERKVKNLEKSLELKEREERKRRNLIVKGVQKEKGN